MQRNGIDKDGLLFKPTSGTKANLAWDISSDQLQYYFKRQNHKDTDSWSQLADLSRGIAGGRSELRSDWVFDNINLPVVSSPILDFHSVHWLCFSSIVSAGMLDDCSWAAQLWKMCPSQRLTRVVIAEPSHLQREREREREPFAA